MLGFVDLWQAIVPVRDALGRAQTRALLAAAATPEIIRLEKPYDAAPLLFWEIAVVNSCLTVARLRLVARGASCGSRDVTMSMRSKRVRGAAVCDAERMHMRILISRGFYVIRGK